MTINPFDNDRLKTRKLREELAEAGQLPANRRDRPTFLKARKANEQLINQSSGVEPIVLTGQLRRDAVELNRVLGELPNGTEPIVLLDFVTLTALVNGEAVTFADQVDDMTQIEAGVGYKMRTGNVALALAGEALAEFLAAPTGSILFELDYTGFPGVAPAFENIFTACTCNNNDDSVERWNIYSASDNSWTANAYAGSEYVEADSAPGTFNMHAYNKVALSWNETSVSISANGAELATEFPADDPIVGEVTRVLIGRYDQTFPYTEAREGNFLSIALYPRQSPEDLQMLSTH